MDQLPLCSEDFEGSQKLSQPISIWCLCELQEPYTLSGEVNGSHNKDNKEPVTEASNL